MGGWVIGSPEGERPRGSGVWGGRNFSGCGCVSLQGSLKNLLVVLLEKGETEAWDGGSGKELGKGARWIIMGEMLAQ